MAMIEPLQHALLPAGVLRVSTARGIFHLTSWLLILVFQGWATVLIVEVGYFFVASILPFSYGPLLAYIKRHREWEKSDNRVALLTFGVRSDDLVSLIDEGFKKGSVQRWFNEEWNSSMEREVGKKQGVCRS